MEIVKPEPHFIQYSFESFTEFVDYSDQRPNWQLSESMAVRGSNFFYGDYPAIYSVKDAVGVARKGLPREGVNALDTARARLDEVLAYVDTTTVESYADVSGAWVNVDDYLTGVPECMTEYTITADRGQTPIVPIVVACAVLACVDTEAIKARGHALVALIEAIETTGRSVEIWADMTSKGERTYNSPTHYARFSIRLKAAGDPLDVGMLMFCMSHPGFFRGLGFNTRHQLPRAWYDALGVGDGYGSTVKGAMSIDRDYPQGAIFLPALQPNQDPWDSVRPTLETLGLVAQ